MLTSQPTQLGTDISEHGCQPLNRLVRRNDQQMSLRISTEATEVLQEWWKKKRSVSASIMQNKRRKALVNMQGSPRFNTAAGAWAKVGVWS